MALSNILREPTREIIETALEIAVCIVPICLFIYGDYLFAPWFYRVTGGDTGCLIIDAIIVWPILVFTCVVLMVIIHNIGENVCSSMKDRGHDPRPIRRY